ncbi:hypothetical protein IMPR6_180093 [Imperialibacter sp. EC-SDR9]|nr:hypothetical protein IMPERIA89_300091 [Imperialibacter sp. 89]CAD5270138.1 hypothetical protein IMPERIA75_360092 [Imperialibacter sp. 75]VVT09747.1 hypothetical protein IMPR6_180093 [Imperialibacter sp. EC-SDR9]
MSRSSLEADSNNVTQYATRVFVKNAAEWISRRQPGITTLCHPVRKKTS